MDADRAKKSVNSFFLIAVMIALTIFVNALPAYTIGVLYKAHQASEWPVTKGIVVVSNWTYRGGTKGCSYHLNFAYDYSVGDQKYSGKDYMIGGAGCTGTEAKRIVNENPWGKEIDIHYHRSDPGTSVVMPGEISDNNWVGIYGFTPFALIWDFGGTFIIWLSRRSRRYSPEKIAEIDAKIDMVNAGLPPDSKFRVQRLPERANRDLN